ncbi:MAG: MFS transporter [Acetobacteraceae bacterium]|jgi:FSR family fosmidomycin resistance protein-like MFS transporter|nr:MFS transporter [Acetobacteraceae bacterium]
MQPAQRLIIGFASAGHFLHHVLTGLFLTLAVILEAIWQRPYAEIIALWTLGAAMIGVGAPLAGWLADRFGHARMMTVFFLGIGFASIIAGMVSDSAQMGLALALLGGFGAIYHPVALAWVSMTAPPDARGRLMGILGIAGSIGVASAAVIAGGLAEIAGWRMAMIIPGIITIIAGLALLFCLITGRISASNHQPGTEAAQTAAAEAARIPWGVLFVLAITFMLGSIAYTAYSTALPKWLSDMLLLDSTRAAQLGLIVGAVMLMGSAGQLIGGRLADRMPMKALYVATFLIKLPLMILAAWFGGAWALLVAVVIGFMFDFAAPVENLLLARYSSGRRRGLAFGLKFAMGFVAAPLGVNLVAWAYGDAAGGAPALFLTLAVLGLVMLVTAMALPRDAGARTAPRAVPA